MLGSNTNSLSGVGQFHFRNKLRKKRPDLCLPEGAMGEGESKEDNQKVRTSRYKIESTRNMIYNTINTRNSAACYIGKLLS